MRRLSRAGRWQVESGGVTLSTAPISSPVPVVCSGGGSHRGISFPLLTGSWTGKNAPHHTCGDYTVPRARPRRQGIQ